MAEAAKVMQHISTGYSELDAVTKGGFPCGRITLLEGTQLDFWKRRLDGQNATIETPPDNPMDDYYEFAAQVFRDNLTLLWVVPVADTKWLKYYAYLWLRFEDDRARILKSFVGPQGILVPLNCPVL
jgi:hypothetical protein